MAETVSSPNDQCLEEHEEGEISDEEPPASVSEEPESRVDDGEGEDDEEAGQEKQEQEEQENKDVPLLHRRVSLDDLMALGELTRSESRKRTDFFRHEGRDSREQGKLDDDGHDRKGWGEDKPSWRKDKSSFNPPNGAYGSNLYNFAWAQAVSGRPSFPPVDSPTPTSSRGERNPGAPPGSGGWAAENVARDYSREMELYRRPGRSSEDRDDLSPIDNNRGTDSGRGRLRCFEKETWGVSERRSLKDRLGGRVEREANEGEDVGEYEAEDRRRRSESQSPNGRLDELTESGKTSSDAAVHLASEENDAEDREEGELEEGEIELGSVPAGASSPSKESPDLSRQSTKSNAETSGYYSGKDKDAGKLYSRSVLKAYSNSRSPSDDYSSRRSRQSKSLDYERKRRLASATSLVKNVTVKDAQKSFIDVCDRLYKALRLLHEFHTPRKSVEQEGRLEGSPREISLLARQAFAGIRAVYAVRNTASGIEQERDKNIFPRLLELANGYCQKLFTTKQTRELEVMMQTMPTTGRYARDAAEKVQYPREHQFLASKKSKEKDVKQRETVEHNFPTTKQQNTLEKKSSDGNIGGRILGFADAKQAEEAAAIAAAALAYAQSSAASRTNSLFGSTHSSRSGGSSGPVNGWGWLSERSSQVHYSDQAAVALHPEATLNSSMARYQPWSEADHRLPVKIVQDGFTGNSVELRAHVGLPASSSQQDNPNVPPGYKKPVKNYSVQEEEWEKLSPAGAGISCSVPVSGALVQGQVVKDESIIGKPWPPRHDIGTLLPYQKNVGVTSLYSVDRLPSPTPSDENEDVSVGPLPPSKEMKIVTSVSDITQSSFQQSHWVGKLVSPNVLATSNQNVTCNQSLDSPTPLNEPKFPRAKSADFTMLPSPTRESEEPESMKNVAYSLTGKGNFKSRDPRRRLQNSSVDFDKDPINPMSSIEKQALQDARLIGNEVNRKRVVHDGNKNQDPGNTKRQKFQAERTTELQNFEQENVNASTGLGGWLDDNISPMFSTSDEEPIAMEVDEKVLSVVPPDMKGPLIDEKMNGGGKAIILHQDLLNSLEQTMWQKVDLGQQTGELGQRKMKPRDPRRALLESSVERADNSAYDILRGNGGVALVDLSNGVEGGFVELSSAGRSTIDDQGPTARKEREVMQTSLQATALPNIAPHFMEKLASLAGMVGGNPSLLPSSNEGKQPIQSGTAQFVSITGATELNAGKIPGEVNVDDILTRTDASGVSIELKSSQPQVDKSTSLGTGSRKPKGRPGQWGASQVHPSLEKLLEELPEEERRSVQLERERRMEEQDRMFTAGKLCLVLDLDHTLLNSAKFSEIEPEWEHRLRSAEAAERSRVNRESLEKRELYRFPHMSMWTKLRPGIWKFLARASQLFELHVYTMGNKVYATEMAKLLDPTGTLFAGRVISKGDDGDGDDVLPKSKDLDGVLGMESAVLIIDDSARVWPHHSPNLIVVERYMYFPCSRRQFGLGGPSLLEVGHDEREADGMIASVLTVVDRIHKRFFENQRLREVDVRDILAAEQRQVLAGCKVVFSRIFPVGEAQPHLHPLWRTAEQFGAICTTKIDDEVTHVVAISPGTDKVNWALSTGRFVVRPAWLEASTILYRRANELEFFVPPQ